MEVSQICHYIVQPKVHFSTKLLSQSLKLWQQRIALQVVLLKTQTESYKVTEYFFYEFKYVKSPHTMYDHLVQGC